MERNVFIAYVVALIVTCVGSYGFIDPNITLTSNSVIISITDTLSRFVYGNRPAATASYALMLLVFSVMYGFSLRKRFGKIWHFVLAAAIILAVSYPALSHDLFNYMTTAKVAFVYGENPYTVMPVEIPNEPYLSFTRAANKYALYGPLWILMTWLPTVIGGGAVWSTIIAFKVMNSCAYLLMVWLIWRHTKSTTSVAYFALNPLVLFETLVSGHNDIFMMVLAVPGILLFGKSRLGASVMILLSWMIKGATVVLAPLLVIKRADTQTRLTYAWWSLAVVFFIAAPMREELYPWYAVWLISVASFMDQKRHVFIRGFTVVLSFALELRHMPYMWMGYYEGPGPVLRASLTIVPVFIYLLLYYGKKAGNRAL